MFRFRRRRRWQTDLRRRRRRRRRFFVPWPSQMATCCLRSRPTHNRSTLITLSVQSSTPDSRPATASFRQRQAYEGPKGRGQAANRPPPLPPTPLPAQLSPPGQRVPQRQSRRGEVAKQVANNYGAGCLWPRAPISVKLSRPAAPGNNCAIRQATCGSSKPMTSLRRHRRGGRRARRRVRRRH